MSTAATASTPSTAPDPHADPRGFLRALYDAAGQPIDGVGGGEGFGTLQQNYLEEGNVQAVTELSSLIAAQRAYEMNSKVITAADQMMSATTSMFRG